MKIQLNIENEKNESQAVEFKAHFEKFLKLLAELEETCRKNDISIYEQLARLERRMDDLEFGIAAHVQGNPHCPLSKANNDSFTRIEERLNTLEGEAEELWAESAVLEEKTEEANEKLEKQVSAVQYIQEKLIKEVRDHKTKTSAAIKTIVDPMSNTLVASGGEAAGSRQ